MTTGNAAIAYSNLFDTCTPTASSAGTSTPVTNLQTAPVSTVWVGTGVTADSITATWTSDQTADTFALMGLGSQFLLTDTVRLQLTSNGGATGDIYDSTAQAGVVDPNYGYAVHLLTSKTFRTAKWTFSKAAGSNRAGRAFVGVRTQLTYNYQPGASFGWVDLSKWTEAAGGGVFVDVRPSYREWQCNFGWVSEAQFLSLVEPMDIVNGMHTDILFIRDTANTNLGLVTVWGLMKVLAPSLQPFTVADLYSRSYTIRERRA
jgi:hypothetical protein